MLEVLLDLVRPILCHKPSTCSPLFSLLQFLFISITLPSKYPYLLFLNKDLYVQSFDYPPKQVPHKLGVGMLVLPNLEIQGCWCCPVSKDLFAQSSITAIFCNTVITRSAYTPYLGLLPGIPIPVPYMHLDFTTGLRIQFWPPKVTETN